MQVQTATERRGSERYNVRKDVFAHLTFGRNTLGKVLDISEGGLAIEYVSESDMLDGRGILLHLFGMGGRIYLSGVPVKKVSNHEVPKQFDFSMVPVRRMGIAFGDMRPEQKEALRGFMLETTIH